MPGPEGQPWTPQPHSTRFDGQVEDSSLDNTISPPPPVNITLLGKDQVSQGWYQHIWFLHLHGNP